QQPLRSPILTLDQERFFNGSLWGQRAQAEVDAASATLSAENRRIEAELTGEEKELTEKRATMPADEFRTAADAFDARVTEIRREQDGKAREIGRILETERQQFYQAALPILGEVLQSRGAVAILDVRAIFVSADAIDVTDDVIATVNARLGSGAPEAQDAPPVTPPDEGAPGTPETTGGN
ncbi:MAG: OmpH family outer membrane protein, partial [Rhodobacteraceae bacterium]|nr:OmpH family outer membrane protein [Paracoccaceae bacterium]